MITHEQIKQELGFKESSRGEVHIALYRYDDPTKMDVNLSTIFMKPNKDWSVNRNLNCLYEGKIDSIEQLKEILDGTNK